MEHANRLISARIGIRIAGGGALALSLAPVSAADTAYDQDLGQFYSYTVFFGFDGEETESILWDFGDGSETSARLERDAHILREGNVLRDADGDQPARLLGRRVYKVQIMGFPVITFSTDGGSAVGSIQQTAYDVAAAGSRSTLQGRIHVRRMVQGERAHTCRVDWSEKITSSATYYAKWTVASGSGYVVNSWSATATPTGRSQPEERSPHPQIPW
jgi:hypothetical protein